MDLTASVTRLCAAFHDLDAFGRGCISRDEFVKVLRINGGLPSQIDVLVDQFAATSNPNWVDYVSFMSYLRDIVKDAAPTCTPSGDASRVSASVSPVPRPVAPQPVESTGYSVEPRRVLYPSAQVNRNDEQSRKQQKNDRQQDLVSRAVQNCVALRESSRSQERSTSNSTRADSPREEVASHISMRNPVTSWQSVTAVTRQPDHSSAPVTTAQRDGETCTLGSVFDIIDVNVRGTVSADDIFIAFSIHGVPVTKIEIEALFESLGLDPTACTDKAGFCILASRLRLNVLHQLRQISTWHGAIKPTRSHKESPSLVPEAAVPSVDAAKLVKDEPRVAPVQQAAPIIVGRRHTAEENVAAISVVEQCHPAFQHSKADRAVRPTGASRPTSSAEEQQQAARYMRPTSASMAAVRHHRASGSEVDSHPSSRSSSRSTSLASQARQEKAPSSSRSATAPSQGANEPAHRTTPRVTITLPKPLFSGEQSREHNNNNRHAAANHPRAGSLPSSLETLAEAATPPTLERAAPHPGAAAAAAAAAAVAPVQTRPRPLAARPADMHAIVLKHFPGGCGKLLSLCGAMDRTNCGSLPRPQLAVAVTTVAPAISPPELEALLMDCGGESCTYTNLIAKIIEASSASLQAPATVTAHQVDAANDEAHPLVPSSTSVKDAGATLQMLLREEIVSLCDGEVQQFKEHFVASDPARRGYLSATKVQQAITHAYQQARAKAPEWVLQRCVKIARTPFSSDSQLSGGPALKEAAIAAQRFASGSKQRDAEWCDYNFLFKVLRL